MHECFGALRYGRLLEFLMYDVRRTMTLKGKDDGRLLPSARRELAARRIARSEVTHVVNMPSNPPGWSAGKWMEWYPDVLGPDRQLTTAIAKPYWQAGWMAQHDRLMRAITGRRRGAALVVGGDMHATAAGTIERAREHRPEPQPGARRPERHARQPGRGFPSGLHGTPPKPPSHLDLREEIPPLEENGFVIADVARTRSPCAVLPVEQHDPERGRDRPPPAAVQGSSSST